MALPNLNGQPQQVMLGKKEDNSVLGTVNGEQEVTKERAPWGNNLLLYCACHSLLCQRKPYEKVWAFMEMYLTLINTYMSKLIFLSKVI